MLCPRVERARLEDEARDDPMSSIELGLCLFGLVLGGFLIGVAVGRTGRDSKPIEPLRSRPYNPVRFPYPTSHYQRRRMVMQDLTTGKLGIEDGKEFLHDHTLSVNDYKSAIQARKQLQDFDSLVKMAQEATK